MLLATLVCGHVVVLFDRFQAKDKNHVEDLLWFGFHIAILILVVLLWFPSEKKNQASRWTAKANYGFHLVGGLSLLVFNPLASLIGYSILLGQGVKKPANYTMVYANLAGFVLGFLSLLAKFCVSKGSWSDQALVHYPVISEQEFDFICSDEKGARRPPDKCKESNRPCCRRFGFLAEFAMIVYIVALNCVMLNKMYSVWDQEDP